jgi:iron complex outermembrane receptor protein
VDAAYPGLPGPIQYILAWRQNLGKLQTSGVDVDVTWRGPSSSLGRVGFSLNGTYIIDWRQQLDSIHDVTACGRNADPVAIGAVPRWRHYAALDWTLGPWGATVAQNFTAGYTDTNFDAAGNERKVAPNDIWNVQASYSGFRNTTLVLGVKNIFDRAPPFSNQQFFFQVGYNPQYSDPRGRMLYGSLTFAFK